MKKAAAVSAALLFLFFTGFQALAGDASSVSKSVKKAAHKTAAGTKNIADKTAGKAEDIVNDITFSEVSAEELEKQASIKTLKNEKKALKAAYNSRIKDTKAKLKAMKKSTVVSSAVKENQIYRYEKQILELENQRDNAVKKYDARINKIKNNK